MTETALNVAELKNSNRYRILDCLRYAPLSRAELSRTIGLAKSSVTTLTNQMIDEGLLCEVGPAQKSHKAGRTRILLDINGAFGFAVGIHFHRKQIAVAATDLKGKVLFRFAEKTAAFSSSEDVLAYIKTELLAHIAKADLNIARLVGIGVSSPGPLNYEKGIILQPPNFPLFNDFPIVERLKADYGCPVFLENNAVTLALFEHYYISRQTDSSLFVTISDGIGGALIQNDEVYRGSHGIAGELGHISIDPFGETCPCGNRGCLEQYATLSALKQRFAFSSYADIADSAEAGDKKSLEILDFLINTLGAAFVSAVNLFDLDKIILYGEYAYKGTWLAKALEDYIQKHAVICKAHSVTVVPSGQDAATAPAAAAVPALNSFFRENTVR